MASRSLSRSGSLSSLQAGERGCSPCSASIVGFCYDEEEAVAEGSIGSPPVIDDPVIAKLFGDVNLDNKSDYDMIDRMIKGEKLFEPEALTALTPFDVEAISRDADRILEKVERKRSSIETSGSAFRSRLRKLSKSYASILDTSMSPSTLSAQHSPLDSQGPKCRSNSRGSRRNSTTSQKVGKGAAKKRADKKSGKSRDKGVGDVAKSGKAKRMKEEKRRSRDKNDGPAVKDKSVETMPPLEPPYPQPIYPSPVCSLCEQNVHEGNLGFAPCAAYGDYRVNYCAVENASKTPATTGDGQSVVAASCKVTPRVGDKKDEDSKDSKVVNGKNVIKRIYRKNTAKEGDKRRTSVCIEETAASQAIEFLDGGGGGRSVTLATDGGAPAKAPSRSSALPPSVAATPKSSATPAPATSSSPVNFILNATTGGPPRPTVRHYRYAETRRPAATAPGEQPGPQFLRPLPPHPLCPVHSPILAGGSPPFNTTYGSPPVAPNPFYPLTNAWWQNTPQSRPLQPPPRANDVLWPPAPLDGSPINRPLNPWNAGMQPMYAGPPASGQAASSWLSTQMQQQAPQGGPFPPLGLQQSASAASFGPSADALGYGPRFAPPSAVPVRQISAHRQGSTERGLHQFAQDDTQQSLRRTSADAHRKSPTSMKTYPWFQFPSIPDDLVNSPTWGRTFSNLLSAVSPRIASDTAETLARDKRTFSWSAKTEKVRNRRPSIAPGELALQRRRSSAARHLAPGEHSPQRRRSLAAAQPGQSSPQRRRSSAFKQLPQLRRASSAQEREITATGRRRSVSDKRRASLAGHGENLEMRRGSSVEKPEANSFRQCNASVQTNELAASGIEQLECKSPRKRSSLVQANETTPTKGTCTGSAPAQQETRHQPSESHSTCSACRPFRASFCPRRRGHKCRHGSAFGTCCVVRTVPTCMASRPHECRRCVSSLTTHGFDHNAIACSRTLQACPLHQATVVCPHEYIPTSAEAGVTHVCTVVPPLLQPQFSAQFVTPVAPVAPVSPVAPAVAGFQQHGTMSNKAQSDGDLYLLLPSPSGQEKLYQARPLSPLFRVARSADQIERADGAPLPGASAISTIRHEVDTWQSEGHPVTTRAPVKTTRMEQQAAGRCSRGSSTSSSLLSLQLKRWKADEEEEKQGKVQRGITDAWQSGLATIRSFVKGSQKPISKRSSLAATGPDAHSNSVGNDELESKRQKVPQNVPSKRPSLAPAGPDMGEGVAGDVDEEYMTTAVQCDEQSTKASKRLGVAPCQRFAEKSGGGGGRKESFVVSQKVQGSALANPEKGTVDNELTQGLKHKGSRDDEEVRVMPAEPPSLHNRSSEHGVVGTNTAGRENSLKEKSAIVEASSRDVPPKREEDDAGKTMSSAQNTPDAKDDETAKEGAEENAKESAEHSAKESAEHSGKENDQQGGEDEAAPPDELPSDGDIEGNIGGGEPEPQVADVAPAAEIRKQVPESGTCTLYPESRFAIIIGLVCFIWIVVVYFLALPSKQGDHSKDNRDSTRTPLTFPTLVETPMTVAPVTTAETGTRSEVPSNMYLCSTDRCIDEGERLRRQINEEMSPCDNFYRYVCSNWELETSVQDFGQGVSISADVLLEEAMAVTLGDYILNERNVDVGLARLLYRACLRPTGNSSAFLQKEVFAALPVRAWPYNGSHLGSNDIWDLAGALVRRYGIVSILDVTIGVQRGHTGRTIELSYPRHLFVKEDYANAEVLETFRSAVLEAAEEFGWSSEVGSLMSQIISVAQSLADIVDDSSSWEVLVWKFDEFIDSNRDIGTFLRSIFARDVPTDTRVLLRNSRPIERLQDFAHTASVVAFINYLCFRIVVHFSPLLDHDRTTNLRRLAGSELAGRVLAQDKEWLLCLRMVESVQPACLSKAQAMQQVAAGVYVPSRIWIGRLEDQFYRNLPRLAWMTERSVNVFNNIIRKSHVARFFGASLFNDGFCPQLKPAETRGRSSISLFVRVASTYQLWRLRQIGKPTRPREYGHAFDMHSRYSVAQQAVYLPVGIAGGSLPSNSTLPVYHASRTAVRLYLGLLPLLYERWDSNEYTEALEVLTGRSANRLAQLLDCLEADWLAMSYEWRLSAVDVELRAAEARYPILAQSAALALAYAAFKELLSVERVWKVDFRLQPLADVTSEQLFFLYYAFDNCERSDKPYTSRQFKAWQRLPPEHRVNMPLRHLPQFAQAFQCNASDGRRVKKPMVAPDESRCDTVRWNMSPSPSSMMRLAQRAGLNADIPSEFLGGIVDVPSTTVASGNDTSLRDYGTTPAI